MLGDSLPGVATMGFRGGFFVLGGSVRGRGGGAGSVRIGMIFAADVVWLVGVRLSPPTSPPRRPVRVDIRMWRRAP
ncbi:hypothetical protein FAIPA1_170019 [Frankia sp. AiPs1]